MKGNQRGLTAEVWMRTAVPSPIRQTQERLYERLGDLRAAGVIDEVVVNRWETYLHLDDDRISPGTDPVHAAVTGFRRWAEREGCDLEPAFRTYRSADDAADVADPWRVVRLPLVCVAIYDGEILRQVAPCSTDERVYTVPDAIDTLERGERLPTP